MSSAFGYAVMILSHFHSVSLPYPNSLFEPPCPLSLVLICFQLLSIFCLYASAENKRVSYILEFLPLFVLEVLFTKIFNASRVMFVHCQELYF